MHGHAQDRRVSRTRTAVREAFYELVMERRYDDIKVGDIIERAGVGRSTFYEHFTGKDDILLKSLAHLLAVLAGSIEPGADEARLKRVLEHFWQNRRLARATFAGAPRHQIMRALARLIEERLAAHGGAPIVAPRLIALQLSEGMLALLVGWLTGEASSSAPAMASALRRQAQASVAALLGNPSLVPAR